MHLWVIVKNWVSRSSEMHSPGTKWLICRFYRSQFITNIYTVVTCQNLLGGREVWFNGWRKNECCSSVLNPVNTLLLPSGSIRQRNLLSEASFCTPSPWPGVVSAAQSPWCNTLIREPAPVALSDLTLTGTCAWIHSPSFLFVLLCCPVRPGRRPRRLCEGHLWRRRLTQAWGSCLTQKEEEMCLLLSSTGPQSLPLSVSSVCVRYNLHFPPQTTNAELFSFFTWPQTAFENTDITCENPWDVEPKGSNCGSFRTYFKRENSEVLMWNSVSFQSDCGGNYEKTLLKICGGED